MKLLDKKIIFSSVLVFVILLGICLHTFSNSFTKYENITLQEKEKVTSLVKKLDIKKYVENTNIEDSRLKITLSDTISVVNLYQSLEKNALLLFSFIQDVDVVSFSLKNKDYTFTYEHCNSIFEDNLRGMAMKKIEKRYERDIFKQDSIYMGNVEGYDIMDESTSCIDSKEFLAQIDGKSYYLNCSDINLLYAYKGNEKNY